jgi:hypothetical protein
LFFERWEAIATLHHRQQQVQIRATHAQELRAGDYKHKLIVRDGSPTTTETRHVDENGLGTMGRNRQ